jgi:anhydro-N-acetylmuramic acid kinase
MKAEGPIWALGAMSGTSLDGVDAAFLQTDGQEVQAFGPSGYRAYSDPERQTLRRALGLWPSDELTPTAAEVVETAHAELLSELLRQHPADLVGFHGQTLAHDPAGRGTHQAGDGALLAAVLGVPVAWDFRSADVSMGGQGAPLAPFFHHACARWAGLTEPVVFLNLGGVGNLTWLDPALPVEEACLAFDTGPANAPMDDYMRAHLGQGFDRDGALAAAGAAQDGVVAQVLRSPYLSKMPPKSLDRNDFHDLLILPDGLRHEDALATLAAVSVACVGRGLDLCPAPPSQVLVCGGGRHNRALMQGLAARAPCPVAPVEAVGLNGDMLEAQAFAYLAVRVARGLPTSAPGTTGVAAAVGGGTVSRPSAV